MRKEESELQVLFQVVVLTCIQAPSLKAKRPVRPPYHLLFTFAATHRFWNRLESH